MLDSISTCHWTESFSAANQKSSIQNLENGHILFFPDLGFSLSPEEHYFLSPDYADPHAKNISYHTEQHNLWGVQRLTDEKHLQLKALLERYCRYALGLVERLLPQYVHHLMIARTSFRTIEIKNRKTSYRKDDKRLHVDAFPSAPNQGKRILRVFSNVNPDGLSRLWRVGEPFESVAKRFLPGIPKPIKFQAALLRFLKITKSLRTPYDHYMLHIHDHMKADEHYQKTVPQEEIKFPPGSTWIVQTDHVSHAAMSGQYVLEQTFFLPIHAMQETNQAPLRVLEGLLDQVLV